MSRFITGGKGMGRDGMKTASSLEAGDRWFWPYYKPNQVSPYVAYYNRKGTSLKTEVDIVQGVWGTTIRRKR